MTSNKDCVVSIDLGTSSVRACLVNPSLDVIFEAKETLELFTDFGGKAEQNPNEVIASALSVIKQASTHANERQLSILALSFSNTVSSLVQLDNDYQPLGNFLTYADIRPSREVEHLRHHYQSDFFKNSAVPLHASYWLPKILWCKANGLITRSTRYFCTIKDVIIHLLTGQFVTDYSNAVATGITDVSTSDWNPKYLDLIDLSKSRLPEILPTTMQLKLKNAIAKHLGLSQDVVVVLGATDGVLSSLGAGAVNPGQVTTMIGSSGACRVASDAPLLMEENRTWSYPLADGIWIRGGAMNSGGMVIDWMARTFFPEENAPNEKKFTELLKEIGGIPAGSDGLIFLPYLFGERAPIWDEKARGVYFGIHASHQRGHFARASIEGIIYALFSIFEIIRPDKSQNIEVRATGGYAQSMGLVQIQADIFGLPINIPVNHEGSIIGAAVLAYKSINVFNSINDVNKKIQILSCVAPNDENVSLYQTGYEKFRTLYQTLKPLYQSF